MNTDRITAEHIAKEYAPKQDSRIVALKKLDAKAKRPAKVFTYVFGTVSVLLAGTGMCLAMRVIGTTQMHMLMGIALGTVGFALCAVNYPIYKKIMGARKKKYAADIMELARRISEDNPG